MDISNDCHLHSNLMINSTYLRYPDSKVLKHRLIKTSGSIKVHKIKNQ